MCKNEFQLGNKNIFVISTGRTATTAFARAAACLPGYTSAHESRSMQPFASRLNYPDNHIEADNRLLFYLPQLENRYGNSAYYVLLKRDPSLIASSYAKRWHLTVSIVRAWTHGVRMIPRVRTAEIEQCCHDFVSYADSTLSLFLSRQKNVMEFYVSDATNEFIRFSQWIGIDKPPQSALKVWDSRHNKNYKSNLINGFRMRLRLWFP